MLAAHYATRTDSENARSRRELSNSNSTKGCLAYFGFSPGGGPLGKKDGVPQQGKPKLLD